jgi:hypothetical protein
VQDLVGGEGDAMGDPARSWRDRCAHGVPVGLRPVSGAHVGTLPGEFCGRDVEVEVVQGSFFGCAEVDQDPADQAPVQGGRITGEGGRGVGIEVVGRLQALAAQGEPDEVEPVSRASDGDLGQGSGEVRAGGQVGVDAGLSGQRREVPQQRCSSAWA